MVSDPEAMARFEAAQNQLSGALSRLLVVSENYPVLQSNQNFLALQNELERTENRINISRRDYNEAARRLNTEMRTFPGVLWAKTMHSSVEPARQFQAAATAQDAPRVNFNIPGATPAPGAAAPPAAPPAGGPAFASP
jgi:LemA protein